MLGLTCWPVFVWAKMVAPPVVRHAVHLSISSLEICASNKADSCLQEKAQDGNAPPLCFIRSSCTGEKTSELMWPLFGPAGFCGLRDGQLGRPSATTMPRHSRHTTSRYEYGYQIPRQNDYRCAQAEEGANVSREQQCSLLRPPRAVCCVMDDMPGQAAAKERLDATTRQRHLGFRIGNLPTSARFRGASSSPLLLAASSALPV